MKISLRATLLLIALAAGYLAIIRVFLKWWETPRLIQSTPRISYLSWHDGRMTRLRETSPIHVEISDVSGSNPMLRLVPWAVPGWSLSVLVSAFAVVAATKRRRSAQGRGSQIPSSTPSDRSNPLEADAVDILTAEQLIQKKCVPCEGGVPKLTREEAEAFIRNVPGWTLSDDGIRIRKEWRAKNFVKALDFFNRVGEVAEAEGHHPDLHLVGYRNAAIEIWTHAIGGLSENDFILAAKIDALPM